MKFLTLNITNFLSFATASLRLAKRGLVLIEGQNTDDSTARSNGAGKTSIIDALLWCLFGITTRGVSGDDVVNNKVKRDCRVVVDLIVRKQRVQITRYRQHREGKNGLALLVDGVDRRKGSIQETQESICELLGLTAQTFLNSVVFGQTASYRFSRLTDKEQKAVLDEALGTQQYAEACDHARKRARDIELRIADIQSKTSTLLRDIDNKKHEEEELASKQARFAEEQAERVRKLELRAKDCRERLRDTRIALEDLADCSVRRLAQRKRQKRLAKALPELTSQAVESRAKVAALLKEERTKREQIVNLARLENQVCESCNQTVSSEHVADHAAHMNDDCDKLVAAIKHARTVQEKTEKRLEEATDALERVRKIIAKLDVAVMTQTRLQTSLTTLKDDVVRADGEVSDAIASASPYAELLTKAKAHRRAAQKQLRVLTEKTAELDAELALVNFWVEGFGSKGLRAYLIDTALPFLNERAQHYSNILTDGSVKIEFRTVGKLKSGKDVERFEVSVTNAHGAHLYKGHSAGEAGKVDLCVGLALQALVIARAQTRIDIAFFDEPFEHIDEEGAERVVRAIMDNTIGSCFVITHNDALKAYFSTAIRVVKRKGLSTLEDV